MDDLKPSTAEDLLGAFGPREKAQELTNKKVIILRKIDIAEIIGRGIEEIPLAAVQLPEGKPQGPPVLAQGSLKEVKLRTKAWRNALLIEGVKEPKFVEGKISDPTKNEIGVDDPLVPEKFKDEIRAHVMDFNGMEGPAKEFFRILREQELAASRSAE